MMILKRKQVNIAAKAFSAYPKYEGIYKAYDVLPLHKIIKSIDLPDMRSLSSNIISFKTLPNVTKILMQIAINSLFPGNEIISINSQTMKKTKTKRSKKGITVSKNIFKRYIVKFAKEINIIEEAKEVISS